MVNENDKLASLVFVIAISKSEIIQHVKALGNAIAIEMAFVEMATLC